MPTYTMEITLLSDTTFARGDGVAGVVDQDVEQDLLTGLPIIKGRTLKGLLVEECGNILYSLSVAKSRNYEVMMEAAYYLFGVPGSGISGQSILHIGTATLPAAVVEMVRNEGYSAQDVLTALTTIRHQTAVDPLRDTPMDNSLRATRAVLRDTVFLAPIDGYRDLSDPEAGLLAACAASVRRAGHSRNRGRGRIRMTLPDLRGDALELFAAYIGESRS